MEAFNNERAVEFSSANCFQNAIFDRWKNQRSEEAIYAVRLDKVIWQKYHEKDRLINQNDQNSFFWRPPTC